MKRGKDVFGKALWDYYSKRKKPKLYGIIRDDGYVDWAPLNRYFFPYQKWPIEEKKALKYAKGRILDIGCGAGRHLLWLQKKFPATGIDISPLAVKICRLRGVKDVRRMSLFDLKFRPKTFDTVIMMYNNFGLAGDVPKTKKLLAALHKITTKDGIIIASSRDPSKTKNPAHLSYHARNRKKGLPIGQMRLKIVYKDRESDWFGLLLVSPKEMQRIAKGTGWKVAKVIMGKGGDYCAILKKT